MPSKSSMGTRFDCRVHIQTRSLKSRAYIEGRLLGLIDSGDFHEVQVVVDLADAEVGPENSEDATVGAGA